MTNFTMTNTTTSNIRVSKVMSCNMTPLLVSITRTSIIIFFPTKTYISKRFYPGDGGRKIGRVHKVLSSYDRFSKYSCLQTKNHHFISKKHNPHFRSLREKHGISKKNLHFERSKDLRIHNSCRVHHRSEYNSAHIRLRNKNSRNIIKDPSNSYDINKNIITPEQELTKNKTNVSIEPLSFSPLKMITKNVKTAYNSLFSNKNVNPPLSPQENNVEESGSTVISPFINLQVTSFNTTEITLQNDTSEALIKQNIEPSFYREQITENQNDSYEEKLIYFKDKIVDANNNIIALKKIYKEMEIYCQNILNYNVQPHIEDNFQNNNVLSLIKTKYLSESWALQIQEHLSQPIEKNLLNIKDMENHLVVLKRGVNILNKYGSQLPESILLEFMRYHRILKNNDAIYTRDDIEVFVDKKNIVESCGEGFTLHDRVYKQMSMHPNVYFKIYREIPLTRDEILQIDIKLKMGDFFVKTYNLNPHIIQEHYSGILMGSGDIIHNIICVTIIDESGKLFDIGINSFTSSKDQGTIYLDCKQIINNEPNEQNKDQYCRPFKQPIYIPENNHITKNNEFTEFATSTNFKGLGINLREKIYQEFINKKTFLEKMPIRMIQEITQPFLYNITMNVIKEDIIQQQNGYNKLQNRLKNTPFEERNKLLKKRENFSKNLLKEKSNNNFVKTSSKAFQDLIKMKNKLEAAIKLQTKVSKENKKTNEI